MLSIKKIIATFVAVMIGFNKLKNPVDEFRINKLDMCTFSVFYNRI